jgi:acetylornithine/succinyldiaminopimelate/putrescine aminotransferase
MTDERQPFRSSDAVMACFAEHVSRGKVELFRSLGIDLVMGRREGARFWDAYSERSWINCHCNGGVFNYGHRNSRVRDAVRRALDHLDVGNHHLVSGYRAELARRLAATTGGALPGVVFASGGGEAVDIAIKASRAVTGRQKIVSASGGYHGHTGLALAAGDPEYRDPIGPNLPGFVQVAFDDLEAAATAIDDRTAAVILEPIPATLGMPIPSPGYLPGIQELCRERGACLILDEVQTGLGRTGKIWSMEHEGVVPDALVTGKGLGGGIYPMSATLVAPQLRAFFDQHPFIHVTTFGGAELGCIAALEVLDIVEESGFLARVREVSERMASALAGLPFQLRRRGLMMAMKFADETAAMAATKDLFDAGVFVLWANNDRSAVQLLPPLVISDGELDELVDRIRSVFA